MFEPVLSASPISTTELFRPALLRRTPCVVLATIVVCGVVVLLAFRLALCPMVPWQALLVLSIYCIVIDLSFFSAIAIKLPR